MDTAHGTLVSIVHDVATNNYFASNICSAQRGAMNLTGRLVWVGIRVARILPASAPAP
jgi:hypothetical protein